MRVRPAVAVPFSVRLGGPHPLRFGTGRRWLLEWSQALPASWSADLRLFAATYLLGFIGVSLFIA
jgi:hypothetical protein